MKPLKKILHVDDDEDIVEITRIALSTYGEFTFLHCASGPDAIAKAPGFLPDLFLLDSIMPEMDGEETWEALKKLPGMQDVPAIFMTVRAEASVAEDLMEKGAIGVITKPFDPTELGAKIHEIWARSQTSGDGDSRWCQTDANSVSARTVRLSLMPRRDRATQQERRRG